MFGFSPLTQINRTNVKNLHPCWSYPVLDDSRWVPTPIVANGIMYVEGKGRVLAFDVPTGEIKWIYTRTYPEDIRASQAYPRHRGVAVYDDKIYFGAADSHLVALDALTGKLLWQVRTDDYKKGIGHSHPPLVADGKVIIGFIGGEREVRGALAAYDAKTGEPKWKTYTVPAPGEPGAESSGQERHAAAGRAHVGHDQLRPRARADLFRRLGSRRRGHPRCVATAMRCTRTP